MICSMRDAIHEVSQDDNVRVIVLSSSSKNFSGGGDIREMIDGAKRDEVVFKKTVGPMAEVTKEIKLSCKPIICSVKGAVAGAAFNVAVASDFCIAASNSKFIQAFVNISLIPDAGGLYLLTRSIGINRATHLCMLGTPVTADQGKEMGFVYEVCEPENLEEVTNKLASKLAHGPSKSYAYMKELIYKAQFADLYEDYSKLECEKQIACGYLEDFKEGVFAFGEKRKPEFKGK